MKKWDKIIYIFFLLLPIVDLCTSLITKFTSASITPGLIVKGIILIFCILYVFVFSKSKYKKKTVIYLCLLLFFGITYFLAKNYTFSVVKFLNEIKYAFKYFYFPVMICGVLNMVDDYKPSKELVIKILISNAVIYTILMIIPYITSTGFNSYTEYWLYKGESGWFFSANEVGAVLTLLLICIYYFINYRKKWYIILVFPLLISIAIIGTKVSFVGLLIMTFFCLIATLINKKEAIIPCVIVGLFLFSSLFFSPIFNNYTNLKSNINNNQDNQGISGINQNGDSNINNNNSKSDDVHKQNKGKNESNNLNEINEFEDLISNRFVASKLKILLSGRDRFLINNINVYANSNLSDKLFGLGWNDRPEINYTVSKKVIEIDVADIFIHYGIIGFLIYFLPLFYLTLMTEMGISIFAGHVLSAPAVSTYLVLLIGLMMITIREKKEKK